jgi:hypothetical protein
MNEIITADYFPGKDCHCEARSSYECGCDADWTPTEVYKLREDAKQLSLERDEALSQIAQAECRAERFCQERDEARNAIVGWENKWKCAIDMAARAELERDEALQDAKNYHVKMVNLTYELADARELVQQMSESNQVLQAEVRDYRKRKN